MCIWKDIYVFLIEKEREREWVSLGCSSVEHEVVVVDNLPYDIILQKLKSQVICKINRQWWFDMLTIFFLKTF